MNVEDYANLVTSEHADKPLFMAMVKLLVQQSVDLQQTFSYFAQEYDLDSAVQSQLDALGVWVGFPRYIFVPTLGNIVLNDDDYRTLLRAKILGNHWDSTNSQLQVILASLFPGTGTTLIAVDNQDMSMSVFVTAGTLTATQLALVKSGLLVPRPEGVLFKGVIFLTGPLFGLDYETAGISGLDVGEFYDFS